MNGVPQRTTENRPCASAPRSEQKRAEGVIDPFRGKYVRPLRGGRVAEQRAELVAVMECHHQTRSTCDPFNFMIYQLHEVG